MSRKENKMMRKRLVNAYLSSVISISLSLLLIGVASLLLVNAAGVSRYLKENMKISVLFKGGTTEKEAQKYVDSTASLPYVRAVRLVTREEGEADLRKMLGEDFLNVFESSPVPLSADVSLKAEYVVPDSLGFVTGILAASPLVDEVDGQQALVEVLDANLAKVSLVFGVLIALLLFVSFVLIGNMVRLSVFSRRFTIHTMNLVGATRSFIRAPFLKAAVVQGIVASTIAAAILFGILFALRSSFPEFFAAFSTGALWATVGIVYLCGVLICLVSTFFVVGKVTSAGKDDLYY